MLQRRYNIFFFNTGFLTYFTAEKNIGHFHTYYDISQVYADGRELIDQQTDAAYFYSPQIM